MEAAAGAVAELAATGKAAKRRGADKTMPWKRRRELSLNSRRLERLPRDEGADKTTGEVGSGDESRRCPRQRLARLPGRPLK